MPRHPWARNAKYPDEWTAVYRLYDAADRLLYVGIGYNYLARWKAHAKKWWWPQVVRKEVIWYDNRFDAAWDETRAIESEAPIHNDHRGLSRIGLIAFRARSGWPDGWLDLKQPEMVMSEWEQIKVLEQVGHNRVHVAVAVEGTVVGALVPCDFYVQACAAMGEPWDPAEQTVTLVRPS